MQWIESTNSLFYTADSATNKEVLDIIECLDVQQKQVFIEVLVIETDVKNGLEFGLQWHAEGEINNNIAFGTHNSPSRNAKSAHRKPESLSKKTLDDIPLGRGFDLGVIGDLILHKGKTFLSLGSLISALQVDGNSTIVLNQKIITQDNKKSSIFVGDNIPYAGSVIETVGASQQTTANIEYKDVGVNLNITPLLGDNDVITLELSEEITQATEKLIQVDMPINGIQTTKTNMITRVHVPDQKFLILSGMIRNTKKHHKSGVPCLGGLPLVGAAFSKAKTDDEKRNIIIFVRPQIIHSDEEYQNLTKNQKEKYRNHSPDRSFFLDSIKEVASGDIK